ncbi:MAG: ribosome-associated translation inhibitor RaiA [Alphaproteobacteria bacterium]|nr:ribosome-associated translation inhibitor RaiA [Alphaproteobacteria bacterium]MBU0797438.1 ribosome-associated translation inhibitor RaiA [Alphaproteobacteria bacterium]MBU0888557.1 ribosome-associated translation inhibitor RaiA [Alphaproteobacteria bacterium]MBU1813709.1 ribosome-associated translation inhibitor RaiA [Alphaproteobacteria bacterium]MBU2090330.1 ribosome-associated translation inhibitor RaiA [Alphaproteobacteria bacterium]
MQLTVKGKQIDVGDALRGHIDTTLNAEVDKYFGKALEASVVVSREGSMFRSDISVHVGRGIDVQASGEAGDAYIAFDNACDRVAKQLRRYKRRLKDHHKESTKGDFVPAQYYIMAPEPEEEVAESADGDAVIIAEMTREIPTLTPRDAAMRMDLGGMPVLMFRSSANGRINVVYRRNDGNIGWIDPQEAKAV